MLLIFSSPSAPRAHRALFHQSDRGLDASSNRPLQNHLQARESRARFAEGNESGSTSERASVRLHLEAKKKKKQERERPSRVARATALRAQRDWEGRGADSSRRSISDRGMLVLLVVLLVPCALVSALVRCDETWSPTALAFASSSALVGRSNAPPSAAEASVIGARKKERTSPVVTVRARERETGASVDAEL